MAQTKIYKNQDSSLYLVECLNPRYQPVNYYLKIIPRNNELWEITDITTHEGETFINDETTLELNPSPELWMVVANLESWIFGSNFEDHRYDDLLINNILRQNEDPTYLRALEEIELLSNHNDFEISLWKNNSVDSLFYLAIKSVNSDVEVPRSYFKVNADNTGFIYYLDGNPGVKTGIEIDVQPDWELLDNNSNEAKNTLISFLSGLWIYYINNQIDLRNQALFLYLSERAGVQIDIVSSQMDTPEQIASELCGILDDYCNPADGEQKNYFITANPYNFIVTHFPTINHRILWTGWACENKIQALEIKNQINGDYVDLTDLNELSAMNDIAPCVIMGGVFNPRIFQN